MTYGGARPLDGGGAWAANPTGGAAPENLPRRGGREDKMTEAEKLVAQAAKDLAHLHKIVNRLYALSAEYLETIDALAKEREARTDDKDTDT